MVRGERAEAHVTRIEVSMRLDQKTGNFKMASLSGVMQWSVFIAARQIVSERW